MSKSVRKESGLDLSNVSVRIFGLAAKYWLFYFVLVELLLGISNFSIFFIRVKNHSDSTPTGLLNILCVALLLCSLWCQSKSFFTLITFILGFDACTECYFLFTRILLALEVSSPFYSDYLILVVFSAIRAGFSVIFTVVLMRLSWCNGLTDEEDVEKRAIYECIQEMGVYKCARCSSGSASTDSDTEKID